MGNTATKIAIRSAGVFFMFALGLLVCLGRFIARNFFQQLREMHTLNAANVKVFFKKTTRSWQTFDR